MNKQELIKKYEGAFEKLYAFPVVTINEVLEDLRQLDEPQKVRVPEFVAEWIEEGKKQCKDVSDLFDFDFTNEEVGNWFLQEKPFDLVARAWLDEEICIVELDNFKQAWSAIPENYQEISSKFDVDIKIFTFECGMEFTQEIEISKGEIIKNVCYEYDDYQWEVPFSNLGG